MKPPASGPLLQTALVLAVKAVVVWRFEQLIDQFVSQSNVVLVQDLQLHIHSSPTLIAVLRAVNDRGKDSDEPPERFFQKFLSKRAFFLCIGSIFGARDSGSSGLEKSICHFKVDLHHSLEEFFLVAFALLSFLPEAHRQEMPPVDRPWLSVCDFFLLTVEPCAFH